MKIFLKCLALVCVFVVSGIVAIFFESKYRELVTTLYVTLSSQKLVMVGKCFFFISPLFPVSFAMYCSFFCFLNYKIKIKSIGLNLLTSVLVFGFTIVLLCFLFSNYLILTHIADGAGVINISCNEVYSNYIFAIALLVGLIPSIVKKYFKSILIKAK